MKTLAKKTISTLAGLEQSAANVYDLWHKRLKQPDLMAEHQRSKPAAFYEGILEGYYSSIEAILFQYKAYEGYNETWPNSSPNGLRRYIYNNPEKGVKYS